MLQYSDVRIKNVWWMGLLYLVHCGQAGESNVVDAGNTSSSTTHNNGGADGAGGATVGQSTPQSLTIMNWNAHNFYNDKNDSSSSDEEWVSSSDYADKRSAIASIIQDVDPDIVIFQEVENTSVLEDLNTENLDSAYLEATVVESNDPRDVDIGALSKIEFSDVITHAEEWFVKDGTQGPSYQYSRDCSEFRLTFNGREIVLLGVHFRSKVDPDDPDKRLAEAQHTRDIADEILEENPDALVTILGDYNDTPDSDPYNAIIGKGDSAFADAASFAASDDQWSFDYNGQLELLDHQIGNFTLTNMISEASIIHSSTAENASDHAPIVVQYSIY